MNRSVNKGVDEWWKSEYIQGLTICFAFKMNDIRADLLNLEQYTFCAICVFLHKNHNMRPALNLTILILLFSQITFGLFAQSEARIDSLAKEIQRVEMKMEKFRSQHQTGVLMSLVGSAIAIVPTAAVGELVPAAIIIGSVFSLVGIVYSITSYRHLRFESKSPPEVKTESSNPSDVKKEKPKSWWTPRGNVY